MGDERDQDEVGEAVLAAWRALPSEHRALLWRLVVHDEVLRNESFRHEGGRRPGRGRGNASRRVADPGERARDRLRLGLLSELVARAEEPECASARRALGGRLRPSTSATAGGQVGPHLEGCASCRAAAGVLDDVDGVIRQRVAPALLPGAFLTSADTTEGAVTAAADSASAAEESDASEPLGEPPAREASHEPDRTDLLDELAAELAGDSNGARTPAARVLSLPGRPASLLTAAGALVLASALFLLESLPGGTVSAEAPSQRSSSPPATKATASPEQNGAAVETSGPRPVIGAAATESAARRREAGAPRAAGARPAEPAGLRGTIGARHIASGVGTAPAAPRPRPADLPTPHPTLPRLPSDPTTAASPTTPTRPDRPTPPPPQPPATDEAVTTLVFAPADRGTFLATLGVSPGWLVTSVVDERGHRFVEHVKTPSTALTDRLHAGRVVVEVTRVAGPARAGALEVSFLGGSGTVLPGSGSYALR